MPPELDKELRGFAPGADVSGLLSQMGTCSESQVIAKPFKRWFSRRQVLI
jgi:hypothetical protein